MKREVVILNKLDIIIAEKNKKNSFLFLKDKVHNQCSSICYKNDSTLFIINTGVSLFHYLVEYGIFDNVKKVKIMLTDSNILYTSSLVDIIDYLIKEKKFKKNQIILFCNKELDVTPILSFYEINEDYLIIWNINKEIKIIDSNIYIKFMVLDNISFLSLFSDNKKHIICFDLVNIENFLFLLNENEVIFDELLIHYFKEDMVYEEINENIENLYLDIPDNLKEKIIFLTLPTSFNNFHIFKLKSQGYKIVENIND